MCVLYTDDSIIAGPDEKELDRVIEDIKQAKLDITVEGDLQDFLGVNIDRKGDQIKLSQPHLMQQILKDLKLDESNVTPEANPRIIIEDSIQTFQIWTLWRLIWLSLCDRKAQLFGERQQKWHCIHCASMR